MTVHCPHYNPSDLLMFKTYHQDCAAVDMAVCSLEEELAVMEVHHWRQLMTERAKLECDMQCILQSVHNTGMEQERIQICMESANLLAHIKYMRRLHRPQHGRHP